VDFNDIAAFRWNFSALQEVVFDLFGVAPQSQLTIAVWTPIKIPSANEPVSRGIIDFKLHVSAPVRWGSLLHSGEWRLPW
jgi:hypothetical protein